MIFYWVFYHQKYNVIDHIYCAKRQFYWERIIIRDVETVAWKIALVRIECLYLNFSFFSFVRSESSRTYLLSSTDNFRFCAVSPVWRNDGPEIRIRLVTPSMWYRRIGFSGCSGAQPRLNLRADKVWNYFRRWRMTGNLALETSSISERALSLLREATYSVP